LAPIGLASRLFEHAEARRGVLAHILHIELERHVPEALKPRSIPINAPDLKSIEGTAKAA